MPVGSVQDTHVLALIDSGGDDVMAAITPAKLAAGKSSYLPKNWVNSALLVVSGEDAFFL